MLDREELLRAVRPAALIAHESANIVKLAVSADGEPGITVSANAEVGDHVGQVEAGVEGDGTTIAFNARYLADVLTNVTGGPVRARAQRAALAGRLQADRRRPLHPRGHARPDHLLEPLPEAGRRDPDRTTLLETIRLLDLRGYATLDAAFGPGPHLVWGPNAAGKTSLLEAMVLLAWGRSHRTSADGELIRWGDRPRAGRGHGRGRDDRGRDRRAGAAASAGRKRIRVNGVGASRGRARRDPAGGRLRARGDAPRRRLAVAPAGGARPARRAALAGVRRRPDDLRPDAPAAQQPAPGDPRGGRVARRAAVLGRLVPRCRRGDRDRAAAPARATSRGRWPPPMPRSRRTRPPRPARVRYATNAPPLPGESARDALARRLAETAEKEVWNGSTLVGPHRDDLVFELGGRDLAGFASRGQQRTAILALKLAELDLLTALDGRPPLLLLDDVFSELDPDRRSHSSGGSRRCPRRSSRRRRSTTSTRSCAPIATAWEVRADAGAARRQRTPGGHGRPAGRPRR